MSKTSDEFKIVLISTCEGLEQSIEINTLSQFSIKFTYLKKWIEIASNSCPEDVTNVKNFYKRMETWDSKAFKYEKFKQLWIDCNMEEITDYRLK